MSDLAACSPATRSHEPSLTQLPVNIEDEMKRSYMDYAMSVIIGRALPDVRDGLKPAHRRVLYGMRLMGLASNRAYRKCAKVVGEVMGNFHPHGDAVDLRHAGPPLAGVQHAVSPGGRPGELRIGRRRPAGRDAVHGSASPGSCRRPDGRPRERHRRLRPELRRDDRRADGAAGAVPQPAHQRVVRDRRRDGHERAAAQPRRGDRRRHLRDRGAAEGEEAGDRRGHAGGR